MILNKGERGGESKYIGHYMQHICTCREFIGTSSINRGWRLKIALSDWWGRDRVNPNWIKIEHQPDGDKMIEHRE